MAKTLIDIPDEVIGQFDSIAEQQHMSRSALIRLALTKWLEEQKKTEKTEAFGILKNSNIEDSVDLQRKIRNEWK